MAPSIAACSRTEPGRQHRHLTKNPQNPYKTEGNTETPKPASSHCLPVLLCWITPHRPHCPEIPRPTAGPSQGGHPAASSSGLAGGTRPHQTHSTSSHSGLHHSAQGRYCRPPRATPAWWVIFFLTALSLGFPGGPSEPPYAALSSAVSPASRAAQMLPVSGYLTRRVWSCNNIYTALPINSRAREAAVSSGGCGWVVRRALFHAYTGPLAALAPSDGGAG